METGVQDGILGQEVGRGLMSGRRKKCMTVPRSLLEMQTAGEQEG